jgi:methylenetetrahydrofolate reductase (NADPH)
MAAAKVSDTGLVEALERPRYEIYPAAGIAAEVAEHVPRSIKVTVTSSERRGLDATLNLTADLAKRGYEVAPHLAARLVLDRAHLERILRRLEDAGVGDVFVIAGDPREPLGDFPDGLSLLVAMRELGHRFAETGFVGYPERHPFIGDDVLAKALRDKAPFASYVITQVCFEPRAIDDWVTALRLDGVSLPVYVGIPGVVEQERLLRISTRIGVHEPARFLKASGVYTPIPLVDGLTSLGDPTAGIRGFHVYTFNELARTEAWRRARLEQARSGAAPETTAISAERL